MNLLGIDIGTKRLGLALASDEVKIAVPRAAITVAENLEETFWELAEVIKAEQITVIVAGLPRNSQGEETQQSTYSREFMVQLSDFLQTKKLHPELIWQDESLTSVLAEERLAHPSRQSGGVDSEAAAIILTDYLERTF